MNAIAERILSGERVCFSEISLANAARLTAWIRDTDRHHTAETCTSRKRKDCAHFPGTGEVELAASLVNNAPRECEEWCGRHR